MICLQNSLSDLEVTFMRGLTLVGNHCSTVEVKSKWPHPQDLICFYRFDYSAFRSIFALRFTTDLATPSGNFSNDARHKDRNFGI